MQWQSAYLFQGSGLGNEKPILGTGRHLYLELKWLADFEGRQMAFVS
jgi:hypothetical protein